MIEFRSVTKQFPDGTVAVDDFSLVIPSRKTTVLRRLLRLRQDHAAAHDQPHGRPDRAATSRSTARTCSTRDAGAAAPPHRLRHAELRAAAAPQGRSTTSRPCRCSTGVQEAEAHERALELLDTVGLDRSLAERYPSQLSGGQQQRVGVARGLAADPNILLMDEPFGAVDPIVRADLQQETAAPAARARQDRRVRHARHRRGVPARRPGGHPREGRRSSRRWARPTRSSRTRPTTSSPRSSAPTAASARCTRGDRRPATVRRRQRGAPGGRPQRERIRRQRPRRIRRRGVLERTAGVRTRCELALVEPRPDLGAHAGARVAEHPRRSCSASCCRCRSAGSRNRYTRPREHPAHGRRPPLHDPVARAVRRSCRPDRHQILDPVNVVVALSIYAVAIMVRTAADALASVAGRRPPVGDRHRVLGLAAVLDGRVPARGSRAARRTPGRLRRARSAS